MSISGPCAWLSSLPPPSTSHLSAITNHWPTGAWNTEQISPKSKVFPSRSPRPWEKDEPSGKKSPANMQPAVLKAENAFLATAPTGASGSVQYPGSEIRLNHAEHRAEVDSNPSLSRMRLDKLNHSESVLTAPLTNASPKTPRASSPEYKKDKHELCRENDKDHAESIASSDEGTGSPGKRALDSKSEKKKMKRFRWVHHHDELRM